MQEIHSFHIPVMGLAFTIDTPLKVAHYGISSVVSIGDDKLLEDLRAYYSGEYNLPFIPIPDTNYDARARRVTAYLDLLDILVAQNFSKLKNESLDEEDDLTKYLDLLSDGSPLKQKYSAYLQSEDVEQREMLEKEIKQSLRPGSIDVNIMTKLDKPNTRNGEQLPARYNDAHAALRGFAHSTLSSSIVFSAGINPRLYAYLEEFPDFYPSDSGNIKKKVILKVSDFRSAEVQGRFLAKKGIWVSEFRIESGLNCGGHAFATEGYLLGPILEEFKNKRHKLKEELFEICSTKWNEKGIAIPEYLPMRVSVQGGIGTYDEKLLLTHYYNIDSTGWGSPFLLVPEATTVDAETRQRLIKAREKDLYLSHASPLGVPFNNLRDSASERIIKTRLKKGRPGSPCLKKHLVSNTEFTDEPICTASRKYQYFKHEELIATKEPGAILEKIEAKACLCEDLAAPVYITKGIKTKLQPSTAICPGPNIAYFSGEFTLKQMVDHIYGRINLLNKTYRPHMFMKEFDLYINYLKTELQDNARMLSAKKLEYFKSFKANLEEGARYYNELIAKIKDEGNAIHKMMQKDLEKLEWKLRQVVLPAEVEALA